MAVYRGGDNDFECVGANNFDCVSSCGASMNSNVDTLLTGYPKLGVHHFRDLADFREICMMHWSRLSKEVLASQHLAFRGVKKWSLEQIDKTRERQDGWLLPMRILHDDKEEVLVVKLMVGVTHDIVSRQFLLCFLTKLSSLGPWGNLFTLLGYGRFRSLLGRSKEGDESFKPKSRIRKEDWPSLFVEVGVAESLTELCRDGEFWLTMSGEQTRVVILLYVNEAVQEICIERWQVIEMTRPSRTCTALCLVVRREQTIVLQANVLYNGPALVIPVERVMDVVPQGILAGEFEITGVDLTKFCDDIWSSLQ